MLVNGDVSNAPVKRVLYDDYEGRAICTIEQGHPFFVITRIPSKRGRVWLFVLTTKGTYWMRLVAGAS